MSDNQSVVLAAATTQASVTLDPLLWYEIHHLAVDVSGAEDTDTVYFAYGSGATVDADASAGENKMVLKSGDKTYCYGVDVLNYKCGTSAPTFNIRPMGAA